MSKYASKIVELAQSWVGIREGSQGHQKILDIYNSQRPLPRGYKMSITDPWCAATTTALAVELGYTDIIPCECSCSRLIEIAKQMGIWMEDESVTPEPGWLCLYDWDDNGVGDNKNSPDHVGVVEKVEGNTITVIEGNYHNAVKRRQIAVNGRYIRGYIAPRYDTEKGYKLELRTLRNGCAGEDVRALQILLNGRGYSCGNADGLFGAKTEAAARNYQKAKGLDSDGVVGPVTMAALLGV